MSYIYIYIYIFFFLGVKHSILSILHIFNLTDFGAERCKIEPFFYFALNNANAQSLTNNHKRVFFFFFFLKNVIQTLIYYLIGDTNQGCYHSFIW